MKAMLDDYFAVILLSIFLSLSFIVLFSFQYNSYKDQSYLSQDYVNRALAASMLSYQNSSEELGLLIVDGFEKDIFVRDNVEQKINDSLDYYFSRYNYYIYYGNNLMFERNITNNTNYWASISLPKGYRFVLEVEK